MGRHLAVIAALIIAGAFFQWVHNKAERLKVDRSPETHWFYKIDENFSDPTGKYLTPVLVPLDLIVMLLLSGALAFASATWGPPGLGGSACYYLILPLAYLAFDLAEDGLLALLLNGSLSVGAATRALLQILTAGKLATVILSGIQVVVVGGAVLWRSFSD